MNIKKIIKGMIGLGVVSGIAYAAFKVGENIGEINERFRDKYDDEEDDDDIVTDDEDDNEPLENYYGTCFEQKYDEPDDGCLASAKHDNQNVTVGYDENCDNGDHFFIKLNGLDLGDIPMKTVFDALAATKKASWISNRALRLATGCSPDTADRILILFENAGYISEKNSNSRHKVYIKNVDLEKLI